MFSLYGIWDSVTLVAHPEVYVSNVFIKPSVRRGELAIDYTLANQSAADVEVSLSAAVEDAGQDVLGLPPVKVRIPAGKTVAVTLRQAWKAPHCWSHVDPYLYWLRSELSSGDVLRTRFGFREFWAQGSDFYLNGRKIDAVGHFLVAAPWSGVPRAASSRTGRQSKAPAASPSAPTPSPGRRSTTTWPTRLVC